MGKNGAFGAVFLGGSWGLFGSRSGLPWGFLGASALIVHQHTKITLFRLFGAIAFPRSFQISVLRGFLGGFFGFIGRGCIFDWLVAFVGLVGLYACSVRRLRSEKRKPANFLDCFALAVACCGLSCVCRLGCCGCFAPVVCGFLLGCCFLFPFGRL